MGEYFLYCNSGIECRIHGPSLSTLLAGPLSPVSSLKAWSLSTSAVTFWNTPAQHLQPFILRRRIGLHELSTLHRQTWTATKKSYKIFRVSRRADLSPIDLAAVLLTCCLRVVVFWWDLCKEKKISATLWNVVSWGVRELWVSKWRVCVDMVALGAFVMLVPDWTEFVNVEYNERGKLQLFVNCC